MQFIKDKYYVVKEEWRVTRGEFYGKYVQLLDDKKETPLDYRRFKWLETGKIERLPWIV